MAKIQDIASYLKQSTRNKIVFCKDGIDGIRFLNVGKELSELLGDNPTGISGYETMYRQVLNKSGHDDSIGMYLALENIGILFEPELKLDVRSVLDSYSKNQCVIIKSDGEIQNNYFFFLTPDDGIKVSLQGLSYKQI